MTFTIGLLLLLGILLVAAIRMFAKRSAEQRAAHDARLKAMAQSYLIAAKKKQAAEAAAAAKGPPGAPEPALAPAPVRDERECPFCAEPILKKARVCKHCGRDVEPLA